MEGSETQLQSAAGCHRDCPWGWSDGQDQNRNEDGPWHVQGTLQFDSFFETWWLFHTLGESYSETLVVMSHLLDLERSGDFKTTPQVTNWAGLQLGPLQLVCTVPCRDAGHQVQVLALPTSPSDAEAQPSPPSSHLESREGIPRQGIWRQLATTMRTG